MKLRDSGMPEESYWESLFDVPLILERLGIDADIGEVAELGCGYGTFTIPIARITGGTVHTFDIEPQMVRRTQERSRLSGLANVACRQRDVMEQGFGLTGMDAVLLFNILHCRDPGRLLRHATAALKPDGSLLVIHWRHDPATPRGPVLDIRPQPDQIVKWSEEIRDLTLRGGVIDLPPWHYGLVFQRRSQPTRR